MLTNINVMHSHVSAMNSSRYLKCSLHQKSNHDYSNISLRMTPSNPYSEGRSPWLEWMNWKVEVPSRSPHQNEDQEED